MSTSSQHIRSLLDRYLQVLVSEGSSVGQLLTEALPPEDVRSKLRRAGFYDRDDVVGYFSWRTPEKRQANMFWEMAYMLDVDHAIKLQLEAIEWAKNEAIESDLSEAEAKELFPGPAYLLPIAWFDHTAWLAVDSRPDPVGGSVWYLRRYEQFSRLRLTE